MLTPLLIVAASLGTPVQGHSVQVDAQTEDARDTPAGAIAIDPPQATNPFDTVGAPTHPLALGSKVLFVNFDGLTLNPCNNNDPRNNCSTIFFGTVEPYSGDAAKRASVIQIVRSRVEDFGITVTDQRPESGDYDMEVVGNWAGVDPDFAGVAPSIDCFDNRGGETSFTLDSSGTSDGMAEVILQEVAHTWGLEHINEQTDLLYPTTQGQNKAFVDECLKIVSDTDLNETFGQCNAMHSNFCDPGWQNSYREMLELFGPSIADTSAPLLEIIFPTEGAVIEGDFGLMVRFADDQSPAVIRASILVEGAALEMPVQQDGAYAAPVELEFPIQGLPDGEYTISIDGQDESDNPASDAVTFTIIGNPAPVEGESETDSGSDSATESASGTAGGQGTVGSGPNGGPSDTFSGSSGDGGEGCGCQSPAPPTLGWASLLVLGLLSRRRRNT